MFLCYGVSVQGPGHSQPRKPRGVVWMEDGGKGFAMLATFVADTARSEHDFATNGGVSRCMSHALTGRVLVFAKHLPACAPQLSANIRAPQI